MGHFGKKDQNSVKRLSTLREAFAAFDKDGNGTIDAVELKGVLRVMGQHPGPLEVEAMLRQMDTDQNGVIDFDEFAAVLGEDGGEDELESELNELRKVFVTIDQDGNGRLDASEVRRAMKMLGVDLSQEEADYLLKEIDTDGDGDVSFEEFTSYVWTFDESASSSKQK